MASSKESPKTIQTRDERTKQDLVLLLYKTMKPIKGYTPMYLAAKTMQENLEKNYVCGE